MERKPKLWLGPLLVLTLTLGACAGLKCVVQKRVVDGAAKFVANAGKCTNPKAIADDFNAVLSQIGFCDASTSWSGKKSGPPVPTGPIADMACPALKGFIGAFAATGLPLKYGCDPATSAATLADWFEVGCKLIPIDE